MANLDTISLLEKMSDIVTTHHETLKEYGRAIIIQNQTINSLLEQIEKLNDKLKAISN